ncbi:hypothetical protein HPP92_020086 [Vanilla planifolia]|uniref:Translocase of chloroplast 159/132 membrane anchor domain-containing protein n=1 Tax=Vanilla planifolia TaxID=51239 RepID=A0A835UJI9_VANPL|nr:hypothetical protein HPP92_020086 [Vanilla planifolia]
MESRGWEEEEKHTSTCLLGNDDCLVRPVLDSHGWDHDAGFDGLSLEVSKQIKGGLTASAAGQTSKDKENFFIQSECAVNFAHQKGHLFSALDFQTAGKDLVCTLRGDAYFRNLRCNSTGCSLSLTSLGKIHLFGAKLEDSILLGRRFELMGNAGRIEGNGQGGFGGSLQATLRGKDYPVRDEKVTLSSTLLSFDKEMVVGGSLQADFRAGRTAKISFNANVNSRSLGQVSFKFTATEQIELGIIAIVSLLQALIHRTNCHGGRSLAWAEKL